MNLTQQLALSTLSPEATVRRPEGPRAIQPADVEETPLTPENRFQTLFVTPFSLLEKLVLDGQGSVSGLVINGKKFKLTYRFFKSIASIYKMQISLFSIFSPQEILTRIASVHHSDELSLTIDLVEQAALGVVPRYRNFPIANRIHSILRSDPRTLKIDYASGVMTAILDMDYTWDIEKDSAYKARLRCDVPVDGIQKPDLFLGFYRQICSNGATVLAASFQSKIEIEDTTGDHFSRILSSFNGQNGYDTIRQRIADAEKTCASVREFMLVDSLIGNQVVGSNNKVLLKDRLHDIAGNPCVAYGVTSLNNIGRKKQSLLPVRCSVGDLINFCTELTSHHERLLRAPWPFNRFIGAMMADTHDLAELYTTDKAPEAFLLNGVTLKDQET